MGYPDYPNNRLIVGGIDLTEKFGLILLDGYTLEPPEPKTYVVDIPGGNGKLDLTEALLGDVAFENRKQEFEFCVIDTLNFEKIKTQVSNLIHGKDFDYKITMDPDYIYHGRFTVESYKHKSYMSGITGTIKISINANPFKMKPEQAYSVDAIGGTIAVFENGRKKSKPIIETNGQLKLIFNGKEYNLTSGTWALNDIVFDPGTNELYLNSYPIHNVTWADLRGGMFVQGDISIDNSHTLQNDTVCIVNNTIVANGKNYVITWFDSTGNNYFFDDNVFDHKEYTSIDGYNRVELHCKNSFTGNINLFKNLTDNTPAIRDANLIEQVRTPVTWGDFKQHRLFEWYKANGDGTWVQETWKNLSKFTWGSLANKKWQDILYRYESAKDVEEVYVKYEVGDL